MSAQIYCPACGSSRGTHASWCDGKRRLDEDELGDLRAENARLRAQLTEAEHRMADARRRILFHYWLDSTNRAAAHALMDVLLAIGAEPEEIRASRPAVQEGRP